MPVVVAMPDDELDAWIAEIEDDFVGALHRAFRSVGDLIKLRSTVTAAGPGEPYVSLDDAQAATAAWRTEMKALTEKLRGVFQAGAYGLSTAIDESILPPGAWGASIVPEVINEAAVNYLAAAENRVEMFGDLAWTEVRDQLVEGFKEGESIDELASRVRAASGASERRARMVARTETIMASNAGAYAQAQAQPDVVKPKVKEWLSAHDARVRMTHRIASGQKQPIDKLFHVGGSDLRFPGDPSGSAAEVVNCRCTVLFHIDEVDADCTDGGVAAAELAPPLQVQGLEKIAPASRPSMQAALDRMNERMPAIAGRLRQITPTHIKPDFSVAARTVDNGRQILVEGHWLADPKMFNEFVWRDINSGWFSPVDPGTDGWDAILTHELGHVAVHSLGEPGVREVFRRMASEYGISHIPPGRGYEAFVARHLDVPSLYGAKNLGEWWAESFKEGVLSSHPHPVAASLVRHIKDVLEEMIAAGYTLT